jgi:O-antigen/teichoic acid export membrane protein
MFKQFKDNKEFWHNVLTLLSAGVLAQAIPFFVLPILQKWFYTPADFGALTLFGSSSLMFAAIASFKYELAIVNAPSNKEATHLLYASFLLSSAFAALIAILLIFFGDSIAVWLGASEIKSYFFVLPWSILMVAWYELLSNWNNRKKAFRAIAASKLVKSIGAESSKLMMGKTPLSGGLIYGRIVGELLSMGYLLTKFIRNDVAQLGRFDGRFLWQNLRRYYRFPLFIMPSVLVGNFIQLLFVGMFTRYFGSGIVGIVGISVIYVSVAYSLMSQSFSQVFFKEIHLVKGRVALKKVYLENAKVLAFVSLIILLIVQLIPSSWVTNLLGEQWKLMMPSLKILVLYFGVSFISSSLSFIYIRLSRQSWMLFFDLFHLLLVWVSIYLAYHLTGDFIITLIAYTAAQVFYYVLAFAAALVFISKTEE